MSETPRHDAEPPVDPWSTERILGDPGAARGRDEQDLASLLAALRAPARPDELAGERAHLALFDAVLAGEAPALVSDSPPPRRTRMLGTLLAAKTAAAAVALATAATAAAAWTGSLPSGLQNAAHRTLGAPAASASHPPSPHASASPKVRPTGTPSPQGPDADGKAAKGLCTALLAGGLATTSTAYANLAEAAGGAENVTAWCQGVVSATTKAHGKPSTKPTGKPSDRGTGKPTAGPGTKPSDKPTGRPSDKPTGRPSDRPGRPSAT